MLHTLDESLSVTSSDELYLTFWEPVGMLPRRNSHNRSVFYLVERIAEHSSLCAASQWSQKLMKKYAFLGILACALFFAPSCAQVIVHVAPPPVVVERPGPPPRAGYTWVGGYHRWDGRGYVWVPGHYVM